MSKSRRKIDWLEYLKSINLDFDQRVSIPASHVLHRDAFYAAWDMKEGECEALRQLYTDTTRFALRAINERLQIDKEIERLTQLVDKLQAKIDALVGFYKD